MSFTAEVKDELSRIDGSCPACAYAELSALMRICGTLSLTRGAQFSLRISTETGSVARTVIKLAHELLDLETLLTVRRSVLHKTRNYLIEIPEQEGLTQKLIELGILNSQGGLMAGVPVHLLTKTCCRKAFVRGAFMAGGFIADPRGDFHLEIAVVGEQFAEGLKDVLAQVGIEARLNHRRGAFVLYLKSFDDVERMLTLMGAERSAYTVSRVRQLKSVKNDVQRRVNAEIANQARQMGAALDQRLLVERARKTVGLSALSPAVREFCELRERFPDASLAELGERAHPAASKSAMYHRLLRLERAVKDAEE
ncbi:MAG: DNA-binding protein WhiA [Atopobiaceae bacterium]